MNEQKKDLSFLELFVLNTIIYFDIFDYPLTVNEIYYYLYTGGMDVMPFSSQEIDDILVTSEKLRKVITTQSGFYFLKGRREIVEIRLERYNIADKKFRIAKKAIWFLKFLPFIKMIAVCNNLGYQNAKPESDIDFFIITAKNRIYLVRFCVSVLLSLLRFRGENKTDRICLSFYTTEDNMDFSNLPIVAEDIYLTFWLATLWPIYVRENFCQKFLEKNVWLKKYLPHFMPIKIGYRYRVDDTSWSKFIYGAKELIAGGFIGNFLEKITKKIQLKKMSQRKKDMAVVGNSKVIISDIMLKFHENDRRLEYLQKFERKRLEIINKL
ncbi:hypothetical protein JW977_01075 [Candidatus Falkowbacteria bacterium]|nr:hypothetical protein [Candidatus Falkowbacteria bacterium]